MAAVVRGHSSTLGLLRPHLGLLKRPTTNATISCVYLLKLLARVLDVLPVEETRFIYRSKLSVEFENFGVSEHSKHGAMVEQSIV